MADEQTTRTIAYVVLIVLFAAMAWFIARKAGENRADMLQANAPKIAGTDTLEGGANNINCIIGHLDHRVRVRFGFDHALERDIVNAAFFTIITTVIVAVNVSFHTGVGFEQGHDFIRIP